MRRAQLAMVFIALAIAAPARAATPAVLIGPDLKPRAVNLQALGQGQISFFDEQRRLQVESARDVLQVRFPQMPAATGAAASNGDVNATKPNASAKTNPPVTVVLNDGQRLVGRWTGSDASGETLQLTHDALGKIAIKLDRVNRLLLDGQPHTGPTPASDQVLLANGDLLEGFVVAVRPAGVELQRGGQNAPLKLPAERVRAVMLANPIKPATDEHHVVWLADGGRLHAPTLSVTADKLTVQAKLLGEKPVAMALAAVARIELASKRGRLIDLAELPMKVTAGGEAFGLAMPPRVEGSTIHLHAPVTVAFTLPAGAARLAAVADVDAPGQPNWADFIVELTAGGKSIGRHHLSAKDRRAVINAPITGTTLTLTLDPAVNGPVMDRLRLRDAMVYVVNR